jgi:hypothetical protein
MFGSKKLLKLWRQSFMRVGPITLMRTKTFSEVLSKQTLLWEENSRLASELGAGGTTHSFMHYPWNATTGVKRILDSDKANDKHRDAVRRVLAASQKATIEQQKKAAPSMWDVIESKNGRFVTSLRSGDFSEASQILSRLFQSQAIWGLGKFDDNLLHDLEEPHDKSHLQLRITDALVSLGQALGVVQLTSVEQQGIEPHLKALEVNLERLVEQIEQELGFDLSSPLVGAAYGCTINERFVTLDGVINAYVTHRLKQLGAGESNTIVEIGGGFGCLAEIVSRALGCHYALYDLPWVNAIQGYFLIMSLPPGTVKLLGESTGNIEVLPFWRFGDCAERSLDFVVNSDSLPEIGFETALDYITRIIKTLRGLFLSINQEAMARNANTGNQNCVNSIVRSVGGLKLMSRSIYWMRQGYVEEVFAPNS